MVLCKEEQKGPKIILILWAFKKILIRFGIYFGFF